MPYPTKPKGGWQHPWQVVVNKSTAQLREKKATLKFTNKYKDIFEKSQTIAEGHSSQQPGPYFYQEGGENVCIPSYQNASGNPTESSFWPDEERLCSQRNRTTERHNGQRSQGICINPTTVPQECGSWDYASNEKPQHFRRDGLEGNQSNRSNMFHNDGISGLQINAQAYWECQAHKSASK